MNSINAEDEYDLELVIPELDNPKSNLAKVTGSFHFILSMFKYYRDLFNESENLLKEYENNLNKRNYFMEVMNEPLNSFEIKHEENMKVKGTQPSSDVNNGNNAFNFLNKFSPPSTNEIHVADKLEKLIKSSLSKL